MQNLKSDEEIVLKHNPQRFVLFPLHYKFVWDAYKKGVNSFWHAESIDFSRDAEFFRKRNDFKSMCALQNMFSSLARLSEYLNPVFTEYFNKIIQIPEARCFYGYQIAMQNIHLTVYNDIENIVFGGAGSPIATTKNLAFALNSEKKIDWMSQMTKKDDFINNLIVFAIVQCIFTCDYFYCINQLLNQDIKGLSQATELISRDISGFVEFAYLIYSMIKNKKDQNAILELVKNAVDLEMLILEESSLDIIKLDLKSSQDHVKYVADSLLKSLGYSTFYKTLLPETFSKIEISSPNKVNLDGIFSLNEDF